MLETMYEFNMKERYFLVNNASIKCLTNMVLGNIRDLDTREQTVNLNVLFVATYLGSKMQLEYINGENMR